jgi:hypothetical protein
MAVFQDRIKKNHAERMANVAKRSLEWDEKRLDNLDESINTRCYPDSKVSKHVAKPPFGSYGYGNTSPVKGGLIYGSYMVSHNISPQRAPNKPRGTQVYEKIMPVVKPLISPRNSPRRAASASSLYDFKEEQPVVRQGKFTSYSYLSLSFFLFSFL